MRWHKTSRGTIRTSIAPALIAGALLLSACGDDDDAGDDTTPSATTTSIETPMPTQTMTPTETSTPTEEATPTEESSPTDDAAATIDIEVSDGQVTPEPGRSSVGIGQTVRITVTSDEPDEVHLHGYDLEAEIGPGEAGVLEFTAEISGIFELETHDSELLLTQLVVE